LTLPQPDKTYFFLEERETHLNLSTMFNLKPASESRNIAMMEVMSGPKDLKPRKESCDENWRKIIEILTVLQKST
jgi:hypothetical protein